MAAWKRTRIVAALGMAGVLTLTACGGSDSAGSAGTSGGASSAASAGGASSDYTIGISVADQKSLFYIAAVDGMKKAAEEAGVKTVVLSADNNSTQQVNQVNDLITQQVNAIVFIAQDATSAAAGVRAANKADIPVIAVDQKPESGDGKLATYIATDSVKAADALCTWMFEQMGGSGEIGILQGVLGATAELQRSQGCQQALDKNPGISVVAKQSANWDETEGYKAAQNMLQANPDIKAIFGESDAMAMGAAKAAKDAGRTIYTVGIDGFPTMITAIEDKLTNATQAQVPYVMGQQSIKDALTILGGGTVPAEQYQDTVLVTQDNAATIDPVQFYGPNVK
ncbi:substrate-binding domain-containing protein [Nakamurella flavida]|uniref:Substrate-binding domain-containing protein n=1 Tax=Nakamurella flavida TaxID=363630 RepID=A0A938YI03_9ACTN|nr:substrate-binding domain-containing protein [Nakamurella flavida]MBM9475098.1 substrate-binding domain-containing protein [Nakamurella flavida]MDP9776668.1 ribose transport system substrate-binding protein [Nakamurella flavida]